MQDLPGAPGTARQGRTRIIVSTKDGGKATQPRAPGHERPRAALRAARHGRLSAALRAPGADVPPATTAGAPGQHRLRAVPPAPDHDRSRARHTMAPGHGRPLAASSGVAGHDRPCATLTAPGHDVPLATTAGAPGYDRLSAVAIATVSSPAGLRRLRQEVLPRRPCQSPHPDLLASPPYQPSFPRKREATSPRSNGGTTGGLRTGNLRCVFPHFSVPITLLNPSSATCHPSTAPPAALLHRGQGLPTPPLPRTPHAYPPSRHCGASRNPRPPALRGDHRGATLCSLYALWLKSLPRERWG